MTIKFTLLAGAAWFSLASIPAEAAKAPGIHIVALHEIDGATKTIMPNGAAGATAITTSVTTTISTAADYRKKVALGKTYYTFVTYTSTYQCRVSVPQKLKLSTRKTAYANLGKTTFHSTVMSFSDCYTHLDYYGVSYTLGAKNAAGKKDKFVSKLIGYYPAGKATFTEDITVKIEK
jgi:hypothetical protein